MPASDVLALDVRKDVAQADEREERLETVTTEARAPVWRELALVALGFGIATVILIAPLALHLGSVGRFDNADTRYIIWNVAWVARTLVVDPLHVLDANIFYPHRGTLVYSESNIGAGVLAIPVYWATRNPVAAHNVVVLLSFVLSGTGMYCLVRYLVDDRRAAAVAGICFAYCPYVFSHLPHMHLLMTAGLPFSMLAFHRVADRPTLRRGAVLGLVMAAEAFFCGYYAVFVALMVGSAALAIPLARRRLADTRYWAAILSAVAVAGALALPLFLQYVRLQHTTGFSRSPDEAQHWSVIWRTYFASSAYAHAWMLPIIGHWNEVLFPGFVATLAGAWGLRVGWVACGRLREVTLLYAGLGAVAFWASFGPGAGLYTLLATVVPAFSLMRAPSRFGVIVAFGLCVLAGLAIREALGRLERAGPHGRQLANVAAGGLVIVAMLELAVPLSFSPAAPIDTAYRVLATLPQGPTLELPVYSARFASERTKYMLSSTAHWMPLVNAFSSYIPQDFIDRRDSLAVFPSRDAFKLLERDRVRYAVFHMDLLPAEARADVKEKIREFHPYLQRRYADDRIWLYEIVAFPD